MFFFIKKHQLLLNKKVHFHFRSHHIMSAARSLAAGFFLKIADDQIDDGVWFPGIEVISVVISLIFVAWEMLSDVRVAGMMASFTITCLETFGVDCKLFKIGTCLVFICLSIAVINEPFFLTSFHFHMTFLGTAYAGILVTRIDEFIEYKLNFYAKLAFRFSVGIFMSYVREFIPEEHLTQHDFLANLTIGYFVAAVCGIRPGNPRKKDTKAINKLW